VTGGEPGVKFSTIIAEQVGRNIAEARRSAGLSQRELAERIAAATQEVSALECGRRGCPGLPRLLRVAHAIGVPLTDLLEGIE
jgi:transcriptional regulator with XRE-family HTH domain